MALNLKGIGRASRGEAVDGPDRSREAPAAAPSRTSPAANHGRPTPPPPHGSPFSQFYDWATYGGLEAPGDVALATRLWANLADEEEASPGPRP